MRAYSRIDDARILRDDDKEIDGKRSRGRQRAFGARQIERAERLVDEETPSGGADQPLHGHPAAMRAEAVTTLSVAHRVNRSAPIELLPAFTEAEERRLADEKLEHASVGDRQLLHQPSARVRDADPERRIGHRDRQIAGAHRRADGDRAPLFGELDQAAVIVQVAEWCTPRQDRNPDCLRGD